MGSGMLMVLGLFLSTGCETKSTDELEVMVSPNRATIRNGETIALRASGWTTYRWTLETPLWGVLSPTVGETVYYRATVATNGVQIITVVGSGTSSGGTTVGTNVTVTSLVNLTGEAYITHADPVPQTGGSNGGTDGGTDGGSGGDVSVTPGSGVSLATAESQTYTASGGSGTYTWSIADSSLGWLSSTSGKSTTYTSLYVANTNGIPPPPPSQFLTVTSGGYNETVSIVHQ